ncbi:anti-sigma factor domain-containing protein [Fredinandcohnia quinoae]|uniref:Anti-sigma factor domain-containing protein n=1 Tax=Fredinandcohnia quinoae TaxID=2918902 RepID=A0AAW5E5D2_9BACI|nr:anti-sigma factor domain-containing protein [Fredinandcohnia sp. SECRCQ15]MCH1627553.1 anti-sigma factor domain-containing protein [Fredinandcohnia sp. SECRCQ15]
MKKGIVMDINDEYITMLTPEGEFIKTKHSNSAYEIGEEIHFAPMEIQEDRTVKRGLFHQRKTRIAFVSSLVAIILISLILPNAFMKNEVYAYMSIDINPSFEVGLDENLRVVSIEALNTEAKNLLATIPDWKDTTLDQITESIINKSRVKGYLEDGKQVLITTVVNKTHKAKIDKELQQNIKEIKQEYKKEQIAVTSVKTTKETRAEAKQKGVSTGKLLLKENKIPKQQEKRIPSDNKKQNQDSNNMKQKKDNNPPHKELDQQKKDQRENWNKRDREDWKEKVKKEVKDKEKKEPEKERQQSKEKNKNRYEYKDRKNHHHERDRDKRDERSNNRDYRWNKEKIDDHHE